MLQLRLVLVLSILAVFYGATVCTATSVDVAKNQPRRASAMSTLALTAAEKVEMEARYGTPESALWARKAPRYGGKDKLDPTNQDYIIGIAVYAAVGIVLAVIFFFYSFFHCCCHCCCHCCEPRAAGYTDKNRNWNLFFALFFAVGIAAAGIAGMVLNANSHAQFTDQNTGLLNTRTIVFAGAVGTLDDIKSGVKKITDQVPTTADSAITFVQGINTLVSGRMNTLKSKVNKLATVAGTSTIELPGRTFNCSDCIDIASDAADIIAEIDRKAGESLDEVQDFTDDVTDKIIDGKTEIMSETNKAFNQMDDVRVEMNKQSTDAEKYEKDAKNYENMVYSITFALMSLPLIGLVLVLVGTLMKKETPFKCAWVFGYFMIILCWLISGIYITIGIALGDACVYAGEFETEPSKLIKGDGEAVLTACLLDTPLVKALKLEEVLDYTNITFPDIEAPDNAFDWPQYTVWKNDLLALGPEDFGFQPNTIPDAFAALNTATAPDVFGRNNISSCDPNNYGDPSTVSTAKDGVLLLITAEGRVNEKLNYIKSNVTDVVDYVASMKTIYQQVNDDSQGLKNTIKSLLDDSRAFINNARCGKIGVAYGTVKRALCTDTVKSFSGLGICYFVIALVGIFFIWWAFRMGNRMEHPIVDEAEDYFVQLAKQQAAAKVPPADDDGNTGGPGEEHDHDNGGFNNNDDHHVLTISDRNAEGAPNMYPVINDAGQPVEHEAPPAHDEPAQHGQLPGQTEADLNADLEQMQNALREQQAQLEALQRQQELEEAQAQAIELQNQNQAPAPSPRRPSLLPPINGAQPSAPLMGDDHAPVKSSSSDGFKY